MGKKFILPPRRVEPATGASKLHVSFESEEDYKEIAKAAMRTKLPEIYSVAWQAVSVYVERKLARLSDESSCGIKDDGGEHPSPRDRALNHCKSLVLGYVGRQSGCITVVDEVIGESTATRLSRDQIPALLSSELNKLAELIGERQAELIFRKIIAASDRMVRNVFGRGQ